MLCAVWIYVGIVVITIIPAVFCRAVPVLVFIKIRPTATVLVDTVIPNIFGTRVNGGVYVLAIPTAGFRSRVTIGVVGFVEDLRLKTVAVLVEIRPTTTVLIDTVVPVFFLSGVYIRVAVVAIRTACIDGIKSISVIVRRDARGKTTLNQRLVGVATGNVQRARKRTVV